eukprot:CAMPEP_0168287416 /NCGR_PEP_ID=MMETSP0142_2-20121227/2248_1 /TAXON_ID=44445 /ORGANISM="Pseudo-nitzschia australis, Strain 10249 10 AB" /LENGTH=76 /DNA_ID=CAMNT_0008232797 /DNA_START=15 /DNA_END=241 /DNA_ORIENTATION=-
MKNPMFSGVVSTLLDTPGGVKGAVSNPGTALKGAISGMGGMGVMSDMITDPKIKNAMKNPMFSGAVSTLLDTPGGV